MLKSAKRNSALFELGIVTWQPRIAKCLVLLERRQQSTKVLEGMLGVLKLPPNHIVRVIVDNFESLKVKDALEKWNPQYILQLSMEHPLVRSERIVRTHSPDHLASNPKDKAASYRELLKLQEKLKHGTP